MRRFRFDVVALAPLLVSLACDSSVSPKEQQHDVTPRGLSMSAPLDSLVMADSINVGVGHSTRVGVQAVTAGAGAQAVSVNDAQWSSAAPDVANVDATGMVSAASLGRTVVNVVAGGISDSVIVTVVSRSVASIRLNTTSVLTLAAGSQFQARATAFDGGGGILSNRAFDWRSSDTSIVDVSPTGLLTAKSGGSATVSVTSEGQSTSFTVNVTGGSGVLEISLGASTLQVGQTTQATIPGVPFVSGVLTLAGHVVAWSSSNDGVAKVSSSGLVTAVAAGTASIHASAGSYAGDVNVTVSAPVIAVSPADPGPAANVTAPQLLTTSVASTPSAGRTIHVGAGEDLQQALNSALPGDRIELAAGATFSGNYHLVPKVGGIDGGWITIQSDGQLPAEGQRMTPSLAASLRAPRIVSQSVLPALTADPGTARWRIIGLEFTLDPNAPFSNGVVELGGTTVKSLSTIPRNVILDRLYVHGTPTLDVRRCIQLNSDSTAVVDSYVSDCHSRGFDSQAIWGWNGNGPYKVVNNYLEASTEVIGFGGADPTFPNLIPSDVEIRGNHITRPLSWKGGPWLVKNLLEFKTGRRVLIQGNVIENSWVQAQLGWGFMIWSVNQDGGCTWCGTSDVLIQDNLIRNVSAAFNLAEKYATPSASTQRIAIRNNVLIGIDNPTVSGGGFGFLIQGNVSSLSIEHNTGFVPTTSSIQWSNNGVLANHVIRNNLMGGGNYPIFAVPSMLWASFTTGGSDFSGNVIALADYFARGFPSSNLYPSSMDAIGLAGGGAAAYSVTSSPASLALSSSSPYKGKATDGTDPGANIDRILAAVANVIVP